MFDHNNLIINIYYILSIISSLVTIIALRVAYISYKITRKEMILSRVQEIFTEYLRLRIEMQINGNKDKALERNIIGYKLYALEEIYLLCLDSIGNRRKMNISYIEKNYESLPNGATQWLNTILVHINEDKEATICNLYEFMNCYNEQFTWFVLRFKEKNNYKKSKVFGY